jgi:hypothetical protein
LPRKIDNEAKKQKETPKKFYCIWSGTQHRNYSSDIISSNQIKINNLKVINSSGKFQEKVSENSTHVEKQITCFYFWQFIRMTIRV